MGLKGTQAPAFTLESEKGSIALKDYRGRWVVLYFYPKDDTPGCTIEATDFTRLGKEFEKANAVVLGVSKDSCESHGKFARKHSLSVLLLSDPDASVQKNYGVWQKKKFMGKEFMGTVRSTFLISPEGKIAEEWKDVNPKGHAEEALSRLKSEII